MRLAFQHKHRDAFVHSLAPLGIVQRGFGFSPGIFCTLLLYSGLKLRARQLDATRLFLYFLRLGSNDFSLLLNRNRRRSK